MIRRATMEPLGWILLTVGILAIPLPGPGLLITFLGLLVLSQQYDWADRRLRPVERAARRAAADSVQTWPRVVLSLLGVAWLITLGVVWIVRPDAPQWWPVGDSWWLLGGWATGGTFIVSALIALALIAYSYKRYRGVSPEEIDEAVERKLYE